MESKANYALVGAIVIALVACLLGAALWISQTTAGQSQSFYTIYFMEHSLSGLQVDSDVTMKGIRIGKVRSFKLSPIDIERVKVVVEVAEDSPIKHDTEAVISRNILTGLASIDLTGGTAGSSFRKGVPTGEKYPIIPEGRTELATIADSLPGLVEDLGKLATEARLVFKFFC